jgi:hypothetical protein
MIDATGSADNPTGGAPMLTPAEIAEEQRFELCQPSPEGTRTIGYAATFEEANAAANRIPNVEIYDTHERRWLPPEPPETGGDRG